MPIYDFDELIHESICLSCQHLVSRTIIPVDYEDFDIDYDEIVEETGEDTVIVIHNTCTVLNMDLGHIVLQCNKYKDEKGASIFSDKRPFKC